MNHRYELLEEYVDSMDVFLVLFSDMRYNKPTKPKHVRLIAVLDKSFGFFGDKHYALDGLSKKAWVKL